MEGGAFRMCRCLCHLQDLALVEWLLARHPQLLNHETVGGFFVPSGDAYFGGYPLLFAVACNQRDVLQCILATNALPNLKNDIFLADQYGNTALHLTVIYDLPEMYLLVLQIAEEMTSKQEAKAWQFTTNEGLPVLSKAVQRRAKG